MDFLSGLQAFKTLQGIFKDWKFSWKRESTRLQSPHDAQLDSEKESPAVQLVGNGQAGYSPVYIIRPKKAGEQIYHVCVDCWEGGKKSILHIQPVVSSLGFRQIRFVCRNCEAVTHPFSEVDISY